jgi:hypothetical protein
VTIKTSPFTLKQTFAMQLINERFTLLTINNLYCFTDFVGYNGQNAMGVVLVGITCLNIALNVGKMIFEKGCYAM